MVDNTPDQDGFVFDRIKYAMAFVDETADIRTQVRLDGTRQRVLAEKLERPFETGEIPISHFATKLGQAEKANFDQIGFRRGEETYLSHRALGAVS